MEPIEARFIRLHPYAWYGHISMRMELYGCSLKPGKAENNLWYTLWNPTSPLRGMSTPITGIDTLDTSTTIPYERKPQYLSEVLYYYFLILFCICKTDSYLHSLICFLFYNTLRLETIPILLSEIYLHLYTYIYSTNSIYSTVLDTYSSCISLQYATIQYTTLYYIT